MTKLTAPNHTKRKQSVKHVHIAWDVVPININIYAYNGFQYSLLAMK